MRGVINVEYLVFGVVGFGVTFGVMCALESAELA